MKKVLSMIAIFFMLVSCGERQEIVKYEDLSIEKQKEIREDVTNNILVPGLEIIFSTAYQISEDEGLNIDEVLEKKGVELREVMIDYLDEKYPNILIDYNSFFSGNNNVGTV